MVDRRSFITSAVAFAAAVAVGNETERRSNASTPADAALAPAASALAIVDRDASGSEAFAAAARARGVRVFEFSADVAALWMREIEPRLRAAPVVIEGYTSAATQFCLEFLARDYGARTVHRAEADAAVTWILSSSPARRAALAPIQSRGSQSHA
ncbi:MAG TPA: hypothetical protein VLI71_04810 [Gammaproteobacteria bacterium]|nr:hypothetical protein [Gammaproteobacteria bacterium]